MVRLRMFYFKKLYFCRCIPLLSDELVAGFFIENYQMSKSYKHAIK